jgi:hypothetical protein
LSARPSLAFEPVAEMRPMPIGSVPCEAGDVVFYRGPENHRSAHDVATCGEVARRIAGIKRYRFAGQYGAVREVAPSLYFVPMDTIVGIARAHALGIRDEHDLFGGVVPHPFVATKTISHGLVDERASAQEGWSDAFARRVRDAVLPGFAAFDPDDACRAGRALLAQGPVRVKRALGIGGSGQTLVRECHALERALEDTDTEEIARYGVSVELHLYCVTTFSVGQVRVDDLVASYCGTQCLTRDNAGRSVYGGSKLFVVRGGFEALLAYDPARAARRAIARARCYDEAASDCFEGLFASRRNYDVAEGLDETGRLRCGVLEQSWRVGGASGAEVEALAAFRADPCLDAVRARTTEVYGERVSLPAHASVYFDGADERAGPLVKYVTVEPHVHA